MIGSHPLRKFLLKSVVIVNLLSPDVEAFRHTNFTLINIINSMNSTWEAGENPTDTPWRPRTYVPLIQERKLSLPYGNPLISRDDYIFDYYDSRADPKNKDCSKIISRVRHQGECSSSWAVASASVMSDRTCLASNGTVKVDISGEDLLTCCKECTAQRHTCKGGSAAEAFNYWPRAGIVTGKMAFSKQGCKPYSLESHAGKHVNCRRNCTNPNYREPYTGDKYFGQGYRIRNNEVEIQWEIFRNGPVLARFRMYEDFLQYRRGIYRHLHGPFREYHYIKLIGWGFGYHLKMIGKYWKAVNSFGKKWGHEGYVEILRGVNECGIEEFVIGCTPKVDRASYERMLQTEGSGGDVLRLSGGRIFLVKMVVVYVYKYLLN